MSDNSSHPVPANFSDAHINLEQYQAMYQRSITDRDAFWSEMANEFLLWDKPWDSVASYDFVEGEAEWFAGGKLNVSYNCIDRHLPARAGSRPQDTSWPAARPRKLRAPKTIPSGWAAA